MAKAGRKPQPTAVKLLKGAFDKNPQRFNRQEPIAPSKKPPVPQGLDPTARACFKRTVDAMEAMDVLGTVDVESIEMYARLWSQYRKLVKTVETDGYVQGSRKHPAVAVLHETIDRLLKYQQQFGLTPSARSTLKVNSHEDTTAKVIARVRA